MPTSYKTRHRSVTFYVLHVPLLILVLGVVSLLTFVSSKVGGNDLSDTSSATEDLGYVLGDDDNENEGSGKNEDDDDEDSNEDEDSDDDDDSDEDDDNDEDSNEDENEDEEDNEGEDSNEDEDEDRNENKSKTQERIQNSNGTYSYVKTETEGDKVKIETKTYDASGRLIKEEKHEGSDEGFESETEDSSGNKLKVRVQNTEVLVKSEGVSGLDNFPLFRDEEDGSVYVQTPRGEVRLGIMPEAIIEKAQVSENFDSVEEVELDTESETNTKLEYILKAKKTERLFGVFKIELPATAYYDAQNGDYLRDEQTFVNKILDFLSF